MTGVVGLGQQALTSARSPHARALAAELDHLGMQVTPENVLQVRNILKAEANRLAKVLRLNDYMLRVGLCGGDPVSKDAMDGFNAKLDRLKAQCQTYVAALRNAVSTLEQTAAAYGNTEQQIEDSFKKFQPAQLTHQPLDLPPQSPQSTILQPYLSQAAPRSSDNWSPLVNPEPGSAGGLA